MCVYKCKHVCQAISIQVFSFIKVTWLFWPPLKILWSLQTGSAVLCQSTVLYDQNEDRKSCFCDSISTLRLRMFCPVFHKTRNTGMLERRQPWPNFKLSFAIFHNTCVYLRFRVNILWRGRSFGGHGTSGINEISYCRGTKSEPHWYSPLRGGG